MKRAATILAAATAGALLASVPARAADEVSASRIIDSIYASLGMEDEVAELETSRNGFFVGVHSGYGADSGLSPIVAGLATPLSLDTSYQDTIAANGYYVYTTDFSLGTYVGGGFGRFNLSDDPLLNPALPRGNYGVQGMAGLTFAFSPSMVLGLEYRYSETVQNNQFSTTTAPEGTQDQTVTLRFDFLLN
jgi:opacity protein-like surface antigen